jgi:hypothetical protein
MTTQSNGVGVDGASEGCSSQSARPTIESFAAQMGEHMACASRAERRAEEIVRRTEAAMAELEIDIVRAGFTVDDVLSVVMHQAA